MASYKRVSDRARLVYLILGSAASLTGCGDNGNNGAYHAHGGPVAESFERLVEWEREELKAHK